MSRMRGVDRQPQWSRVEPRAALAEQLPLKFGSDVPTSWTFCLAYQYSARQLLPFLPLH